MHGLSWMQLCSSNACGEQKQVFSPWNECLWSDAASNYLAQPQVLHWSNAAQHSGGNNREQMGSTLLCKHSQIRMMIFVGWIDTRPGAGATTDWEVPSWGRWENGISRDQEQSHWGLYPLCYSQLRWTEYFIIRQHAMDRAVSFQQWLANHIYSRVDVNKYCVTFGEITWHSTEAERETDGLHWVDSHLTTASLDEILFPSGIKASRPPLEGKASYGSKNNNWMLRMRCKVNRWWPFRNVMQRCECRTQNLTCGNLQLIRCPLSDEELRFIIQPGNWWVL